MNPALSATQEISIHRKGGVKKPIRILVTAGPTREFIDPIRFISNSSTGRMGYEIAKLAQKRGHNVVLISGPVSLTPQHIKTIYVVTAEDMFKQVKKEFKNTDCLVMAAAVSDFKPKIFFKHKIKKEGRGLKELRLKRTPDTLLWAGKNKEKRLIVGFCMETQGLISKARKKLKTKNADIIVANKIDRNNPTFGDSPTKVSILDKFGAVENIGPTSKGKIAEILLNKIEALAA